MIPIDPRKDGREVYVPAPESIPQKEHWSDPDPSKINKEPKPLSIPIDLPAPKPEKEPEPAGVPA